MLVHSYVFIHYVDDVTLYLTETNIFNLEKRFNTMMMLN